MLFSVLFLLLLCAGSVFAASFQDQPLALHKNSQSLEMPPIPAASLRRSQSLPSYDWRAEDNSDAAFSPYNHPVATSKSQTSCHVVLVPEYRFKGVVIGVKYNVRTRTDENVGKITLDYYTATKTLKIDGVFLSGEKSAEKSAGSGCCKAALTEALGRFLSQIEKTFFMRVLQEKRRASGAQAGMAPTLAAGVYSQWDYSSLSSFVPEKWPPVMTDDLASWIWTHLDERQIIRLLEDHGNSNDTTEDVLSSANAHDYHHSIHDVDIQVTATYKNRDAPRGCNCYVSACAALGYTAQLGSFDYGSQVFFGNDPFSLEEPVLQNMAVYWKQAESQGRIRSPAHFYTFWQQFYEERQNAPEDQDEYSIQWPLVPTGTFDTIREHCADIGVFHDLAEQAGVSQKEAGSLTEQYEFYKLSNNVVQNISL